MPAELTELVSAALGRTMTGGELARIGERIVTVERLFVRRDGAADRLPARWSETPLSEGRAAGHLPALDDLLGEYYRRHGWSEHGDPTPERLNDLGIAFE
jgi:aldehyde:ferredoxin oxidoreductase